jgi:transposase
LARRPKRAVEFGKIPLVRMLERQMFGQACIDLLRRRSLLTA